jgi:hypothetical protein
LRSELLSRLLLGELVPARNERHGMRQRRRRLLDVRQRRGVWERELRRELRRKRPRLLPRGHVRDGALLHERDVRLRTELRRDGVRRERRLRGQVLERLVPDRPGMRERRVRVRRDLVRHRVLLGWDLRP